MEFTLVILFFVPLLLPNPPPPNSNFFLSNWIPILFHIWTWGEIYPKEGKKNIPALFEWDFTRRKGVILITTEPILWGGLQMLDAAQRVAVNMPFESGPQTTKTAIWGGITFVRKKQWRLSFKWACKFHSILGSFHFFPKEIFPCLFKIILINQTKNDNYDTQRFYRSVYLLTSFTIVPWATSLNLLNWKTTKLCEKIFLQVNNPEFCFFIQNSFN